MLAEVVLSSSPSSQLAAGFPRCHARPRMRDSIEIMPALVFKYENAHIVFLITHTIELKLFRRLQQMAGSDQYRTYGILLYSMHLNSYLMHCKIA